MSRTVLVLSFVLVASVAALVGVVVGGGGVLPYAQAGLRPGFAPLSFAEVVERVNPAVVHITATQAARTDDDDRPGRPGGVRRGEGSGFIIDPAGYILTNHHLVASPERIRVRLADKREFAAVLVGSDPSTDLALLKVKAADLPVVKLGDSDDLRVGEWVCAIGNPYRFEHSVTVGVVSSKGRKIYDASFDAYIQTDAAINPGNSGGPLVNAAGEAVGVNAAVSAQGQGIGFAVPINVAREVLGPLRAQGRVSRGYLGVQLQELEPDLQALLRLPSPNGALVLDVVQGEPGDTAGLERYDVITHVAGQPVADGDQLIRLIAARPPGSAVQLGVFRDGRAVSLTAQLQERAPGDEPDGVEDEEDWEEDHSKEGDALGLVVADPTGALAEELKELDRTGVSVREVVGLSPGIETLAAGDVIVEVNRQPTSSLAEYRKVVAGLKDGEPAYLFVYRPRPGTALLAKVVVDRPPAPKEARH
ncbi:MAG TPA: trypsin-like peptidase domain-containing protein [Vicinamibacteria bacterium]|nr:trypsin-like peptidase domain-containing protein [Vicinamibacteria bacterium]